MPLARAVVECPIHESFRVAQVAGMFDVPLAEKCREAFEVDVPSLDEDWQIGVIVGPSGSGKSTIARQVFGETPCSGGPWPADRAVIDGFDPDVSIKRVTRLLTAVGFSSPPAWIKPYRVLSCGERFRCDLARRAARQSRAGRLRRVYQRRRSDRRQDRFGRRQPGGPLRRLYAAIRCRHVPL